MRLSEAFAEGAGVVSFLSLIGYIYGLEDYQERLDDQGRGYLERVRAAAQRMGQLIDDLIQRSRVSRAELAVRPVDLTALALEIAGHVDAVYPKHHVEFTVAPHPVVRADEALLRIALENLLDNAWKFTVGQDPARVEDRHDRKPDIYPG